MTKKIVLAFGRMNPPTFGHEKLVQKGEAEAQKAGASFRLYLSHSQGKKDPLSYDEKVKFARLAFGKSVTYSAARNIVEILKEINKEGYTDVIYIAGSDRIKEFNTFLKRYNKKEYNFNSITIVSAGERDPDAEGVEGISASKMREFVKQGNKPQFRQGAPKRLSQSQKNLLFNAVKKAMGEETMSKDINTLFENYLEEKSKFEFSADSPLNVDIRKVDPLKRVRTKQDRYSPKANTQVQPTKLRYKNVLENSVNQSPLDTDNIKDDPLNNDPLTHDRFSPVPTSHYRHIRHKYWNVQEDHDTTTPHKTNPKLDLLLRLGLADPKQLQTYRRALRSSEKQALSSPQLRTKLADLLDKLIDMITKDPSAYARIRQDVIKGKKEAQKIKEEVLRALHKKAEKNDLPFEVIREVYIRGLVDYEMTPRENITEQQWAFARVNSFVSNGAAASLDEDLRNPKDNPCWKGYEPVGVKKKNGKTVPNCVPVKETVQKRADMTVVKIRMPDGRIVYRKDRPRTSVQQESAMDNAMAAMKREFSPEKAKEREEARRQYRANHPDFNKWLAARGKENPYKKKTQNEAKEDGQVSEQLSTHSPIPLSKRVKRVKSFHAWHPKTNEAYTGSEKVSSDPNNPLNRQFGTDALRNNYAAATPGQEVGKLNVAHYSDTKPAVGDNNDTPENKNTKTPSTYKDVRKALAGIRESFIPGIYDAPTAADLGMKTQGGFAHHPSVAEYANPIYRSTKSGSVEESDAWQRKEGQNPEGGLNKKGIASYRRANPGSKLSLAVTTKPSKLKKDSKAWNRRKSFCARMGGMKKRLTSAKTANDPDSRINKSLRKWNC